MSEQRRTIQETEENKVIDFNKKKRQRKPVNKYLVIWIATVAILVAVIYGTPAVRDVLKSTYVLENDIMEISENVSLYIARDEVVYGAPYTGSLVYIAEEGQLMKKGTQILDMTAIETETAVEKSDKYDDITKHLGDNMVVMENFTSLRKGVVSYFVDGNEGLITLDSVYNMTEKQMKEIDSNPEDLERDDAEQGEPIFKIVDNSSWAMVFWTDLENEDLYVENNRVTVVFDEDEVRATVSQVKKEENRLKVVLSTNRYYEKFAEERNVEAKIIIEEEYGLIAEKDSITQRFGGKEGVYVITSLGEERFLRVEVILENDDEVLIREGFFYDENDQVVNSVWPYQEILSRPSNEEEYYDLYLEPEERAKD